MVMHLPNHALREREVVVEIFIPSRQEWDKLREGVVFECPMCKKRGTLWHGGKPPALDTRAAKSRDEPRNVKAVVWQGMECVVCKYEITLTLAYQAKPHES
jgi:hypothetical protein